QRRPSELRSGSQFTGRRVVREGAVLGVAQSRSVRCSLGGCAWPARHLRLHGTDDRGWRAVYRRVAHGRDGDFLQKGLQVVRTFRSAPPPSRPSARRAVAGVIVAAVPVAAASSLQAVREIRYPPPAVTAESLYLTSGKTARRLSVGYAALAADLYWIR